MATELIRATEEYQVKIADKQQEIHKLSTNINNIKDQLQTLTNIINKLTTITKQNNNYINNQEIQLLNQENISDILLKRIRYANKWKSIISISNEFMNQTKQFYLDHDQTTIHKYTNIIRNYEEEIKEELNYSQIIAQYAQEEEELQKKLTTIQSAIDKQILVEKQTNQEIHNYQITIQQLEQHNETVEKKLESVKLKLRTLTKERDEIKKHITTLEIDLSNRTDELTKLKQHIQIVRQQIQEKELRNHQQQVYEHSLKNRYPSNTVTTTTNGQGLSNSMNTKSNQNTYNYPTYGKK